MKFSETLTKTDPGLMISPRHDQWLMHNDHPIYTATAVSFAVKMLQSRDRDRTRSLSASGLGDCARYQQFVWLGMRKLPPTPTQALKMHNGAFMHLRWQMAGLTEGWLADAEVPVHHETLKLRGTMDGLLEGGSILELKSINANGFRRVQTFGPLVPHLFQMATYVLCTMRKKGVFLYECKDNQEYVEIPVTPADLPMIEARARAENILAAVERRELYEPLSKCLDQEGWVYNSCPFRDRCLKIRNWDEAVA